MANPCSVESCDRPSKSKGLCSGHYERLRLTGSLRPGEPLGWKPEKPTACTVEGCTRDVRSKGSLLCDAHYMRQRLKGDVQADVPVGGFGALPMNICAVEGCELAVRSRNSLWCEAHYYRVRKTGTPRADTPLIPHRHGERACAVDGCDRVLTRGSVCAKHEARVRRHGDPHVVIAPEDRNVPRGPDNHMWTDEPSYAVVHQRIRRAKGPARLLACVDCGSAASHWSYSGEDYEGELPYTHDLDAYLPRCVTCHRQHDMSRRADG